MKDLFQWLAGNANSSAVVAKTNCAFCVLKMSCWTVSNAIICKMWRFSFLFILYRIVSSTDLSFLLFAVTVAEQWFTQLPSSGPQFRYKTRVYKQTNLDEKALAKLSTKVFLLISAVQFFISTHWHPFPSPSATQASLKKFLDYIQTGAIEKIAKILDKGLDPNLHDPDSGGEFIHSLCANSQWILHFSLSDRHTFVPQRRHSLWPSSRDWRWRASGCWFRAVHIWTLEAGMVWHRCTKPLEHTIMLGCW